MSDTLEDYKAVAFELKELNKKKKAIKEMAKKEGIKLVAARGKKDRCQEYNTLHTVIQPYFKDYNTDIEKVFADTVSAEKPQGQKWVIFTLQGNYSFAILNNNIKK